MKWLLFDINSWFMFKKILKFSKNANANYKTSIINELIDNLAQAMFGE